MRFLDLWARRRAIRSYARNLPRLLMRDYGFSRYYTEDQVRKTIALEHLSTKYTPYALLMFCDGAAQGAPEDGRNGLMRREIAEAFARSNPNLTFASVLSAAFHGMMSRYSHPARGGDT